MTAGQSLVGFCFMCTSGTGEWVKFQRSVSSGSRGLSTWESPHLVPDPVPFSLFLPQWPSWCCLWSIYLFYANRTDNYLNTQFQIIWSFNVGGRAAKKKPHRFRTWGFGFKYLFTRSMILDKLLHFPEPKNLGYKIGMTLWVYDRCNHNSWGKMCFGI